MKLVLIGVNHSHPGLYSMVSYSKEQLTPALFASHELLIREYQINRPVQAVAADLYGLKADLYAFSVYIWNAPYIDQLLDLLHGMLPAAHFLAGGPEVSYDLEAEYQRQPLWDLLLPGDGEAALAHLLGLPGSVDEVIALAKAAPSDFFVHPNDLPFIYPSYKDALQGSISYYESSRGCPYHCSYCVSSLEHSPSFRDLEKVFTELSWFIDHDYKLVKFLDRSFNFPPERARQIWTYLIRETEGVAADQRPCFHFELEASLLDEESVALLEAAPEGLFQFEIGLQSIHPHILKLVHRRAVSEEGFALLERLIRAGKQKVHLDLIAGLPGETREELALSYERCFALAPDMLQLGHLKILRGTPLVEVAQKRAFVWNPRPPYEVLVSDRMSVDDLVEADVVADMTDRYAHKPMFPALLPALPGLVGLRPYDLMAALGKVYRRWQGPSGRYLGREEQYFVMKAFLEENLVGAALASAIETLIEDYEKTRKRGSLSWEKLSQKHRI